MADQEVQLPQLGESVTEGIITQWLVEVGDEIEQDQPIVEISTDKVDTEIPSPVAGVLKEKRAEVDDTVEVGQVLAVVGSGAPAEDAADDAGGGDEEAEEAQAQQEQPAEEPAEEEPREEPSSDEGQKSPSGGDHEFDVVILGAGTGGYSTALRAAQLDLKVALIEKEKVGGTCLHWGCIPTKAILQTAEVAEHAQDAADFGVKLDYEGIEVKAVNEHKDDVVNKMYKGLQNALKGRGVETILGTGTVVDRNTVRVETEDGERTVTGRALVLATGSKPRELPFAEFDGKRIINSDHALYLDKLPKKAIILGSGAVGMEFASAWHAFGVEVTVVELLDRVLPLEDADSSREVAKQFKRKGIEVLTGAEMTEVKTNKSSVTCTVKTGDDETQELKADLLLVAVGRAPVSEGLGFEELGVETEKGFVQVDEYCRTSVEGVYALGDVIPTLGLAHASFAEGFLVADQLAGREALPIDYKGVPRVTYSHPEVGSVGYTEQEAKDEGFDVVVEKYPFQALARAQMMKASGTVKIVAEKDESAEGGAGRILGIHIVGPRATELVGEGELIYNWEAHAIDVARFIHAHPSLAEAIGEAHLALAGRALHG